jgi:protoporphyrinogen/coproporphyrinogen III oxidase
VATRGRALVVGGGIAGLVFALDALDAGLDVTVLEGSDRLGGAVRHATIGTVRVDVGAESFALTRPEMLELVDRLGLGDDVVRPAAQQAHVVAHGRRLALPPGLLGIPADPADIAALLGADVASNATRRDAAPVQSDAPTTIGRLVRDRLGDRVAEVLVDPVLAGVHATRADDAELASVAPTLHTEMRTHGGLMPAVRALRGALGPAGSPVASLDGGMGLLVERLHRTLVARGTRVRTGVTVTSLRFEGAWYARAGGEGLEADVLCLAVPADAARGLLADLDADPDGHVDGRVAAAARTVARSLAALPTTHDVTLVTLLVEDPVLERAGAPVGSGILVADDTTRAKAMTHASAKWAWLAHDLPPAHHVVRLSYGGTEDLDPLERDDDAALVRVALADLRRLLDDALGDPVVRGSLVTHWRGALSRPVVGRADRLSRIDAALPDLPGMAMTGSAVAGNGLAGVVARSRLEAARTL